MKRKAALLLGILFSLSSLSSVLTGCNPSNGQGSETLTLDVFDALANYQGIQKGWFAKIVKDKFNIELNIIAPNVTGSGTSLYDSRVAAGNLGDIIISGADSGLLTELVKSGLLLDMSGYITSKPIYSNYSSAIIAMKEAYGLDGIYAIPTELSTGSFTLPSEGLAPNYGAYLRWDYYSELGCPEIASLENLPQVLASMQTIAQKDYDEPVYAISYFNDWNGNLLNIAKQQCCFYGYDESGFVLAKADGTDYQNILDRDSLYVRSLKFLYSCNKLGLIDPESVSQTYSDAYAKYSEGRVLYAPWPWISQAAYNTAGNLAEGKGYEFVPISDELIYSYGCNPNGNQKTFIGIGSNVKDPQRVINFIDWLYSSEGIKANSADIYQNTAGPEGLTWEYTESGPKLTELGEQILLKGDADIPDEWGGLTWKEGISALNVVLVNTLETDEYGYRYYCRMWDSVIKLTQSDIDREWSEKYKETSVINYLTAHSQIIVSPGTDYVSPEESTELKSIRKQCADLVIEYSEKMIYAESEKEFYDLLDAMCERAKILGYDQIYEFDLENAQSEGALKQSYIKGN